MQYPTGETIEARRNLDRVGRTGLRKQAAPSCNSPNDFFDATASITVCPFTRSTAGAAMIRLAVENSVANGLESQSFLMVDKIGTLPKTKLGRHIGTLGRTDMMRLERAMLTFLGLVL